MNFSLSVWRKYIFCHSAGAGFHILAPVLCFMSDGEMEEKELIYLCALSRIFLFKPSLVNGILTAGLLNDIFEGPAAWLRELFCGDREAAEKIRDPALLEQTAADLKWMRGKEVSVLEITNERYPRLLKECPDAPPVLYYIGKAELNPARSISIVGTRLASCYGKESCRHLADYFAKNGYRPMIVSGLAYGIDINVHRSALEFGMDIRPFTYTGCDAAACPLLRYLCRSCPKY